MRNTKVLILLALFLLSIISFFALIISPQKLRKCPDHWIVNIMPVVETPESNLGKEYFIIDGERKELEDLDFNWIIQNCKIDKEFVY